MTHSQVTVGRPCGPTFYRVEISQTGYITPPSCGEKSPVIANIFKEILEEETIEFSGKKLEIDKL